jgi:hypothetical protein
VTSTLAEAEPSPVFVDQTGRRGRRLRGAGWVVGVAFVGVTLAMISGLLGTQSDAPSFAVPDSADTLPPGQYVNAPLPSPPGKAKRGKSAPSTAKATPTTSGSPTTTATPTSTATGTAGAPPDSGAPATTGSAHTATGPRDGKPTTSARPTGSTTTAPPAHSAPPPSATSTPTHAGGGTATPAAPNSAP